MNHVSVSVLPDRGAACRSGTLAIPEFAFPDFQVSGLLVTVDGAGRRQLEPELIFGLVEGNDVSDAGISIIHATR